MSKKQVIEVSPESRDLCLDYLDVQALAKQTNIFFHIQYTLRVSILQTSLSNEKTM
jgi:hypothetical protein